MDSNKQIYEIGYLLTPFLPEDQVLAAVERLIKEPVKKLSGEVISEQAPKLISLTYSMSKVIDNKKNSFKDAYFGAVKFEGEQDKVNELVVSWRQVAEFVRFLVMKSERDLPEPQFVPRLESSDSVPLSPVESSSPAKDEDKKAIDAVIDREIAELLTSTTEAHVS